MLSLPIIDKKILFPFLSTLVLFLSIFAGIILVQKQQDLRTRAAGNTYYVATNGSDSSPGTLSKPWRTIAKANQTLQAGDTVFIRSGTFKEVIKPVRSGTNANRIIFSNYSGEKVVISNVNEPLVLSSRSYITIRGLEFRNVGTYLTMANGDYNHIEYNTFADSTYWRWAGMNITDGSTNNWFHHNSISGHGDYIGGEDRGDMISVRGSSDYNLFEDNEIFHGGHSPFSLGTSFNIVRNNYFHNEVWKKGFGNRDMDVKDDGQNLLEGNRFGFSGIPNDINFGDGIQMSSPKNIVRYNSFYENSGSGLKISTHSTQTSSGNHVYNNVFYHNGVNVNPEDTNRVGLRLNGWAARIIDTAIKNNIFYKNLGGPTHFAGAADSKDQIIVNNWENGDPRFVDTTAPGPGNSNLPDFQLRSSSPSIDAGTHLTETASSGSGNSLKVKDGLYFSDGFGIVSADWIKIGSSSPVQIKSVNGNTITLSASRNWGSNDKVWLYKDSRGNIVFQGNAPDMGAFESGGVGEPPPITLTPTPTKIPTLTPTLASTPGVSLTPIPPISGNLITNPSFESGTQGWSFNSDGVAAFTTSSAVYEGTSAAKVSITTPGSNVQLFQKGINLEPNTSYSLTFAAFSNTGHDMAVILHKHGEPFTNYGLNTTLDLGITWKTFSFDFTTNDLGGTTVADARLRFWMAPYDSAGDEYFIDAVSLTKTSTACTLIGDVNCDSIVNILDFQLLNNLFGTNNPDADLNGDGIVNILDFQILNNNFGKTGG